MPKENIKNVRSEHIRNWMKEQEELNESIKQTTEETIKQILGEEARKKINEVLLSEDKDSFTVDEVGKEETKEKEDKGEDEKKNDSSTDVTTSTEEEKVEYNEPEEGEDAFAEYKLEDGDYDLTGMSIDDFSNMLPKIVRTKNNFKVLSIQNDEGEDILTLDINLDALQNATSTDSDGEETVLDVTLDDGGDELDDTIFEITPDDEENIYEYEVDEGCHMNEDTNLGYTDSYQSKTAMTTPQNNETANPKATYSMDAGVPKGTKKPFAGPIGKTETQPYEEEIDEAMTTQEDGPYNRGDGMLHGNSNQKAAIGRNASIAGRKVHGTGQNSYSETQMESIQRGAKRLPNEIHQALEENKVLQSLVPELQENLQEMVVINRSMGHLVRLISENTTTQDEKKEILNRFSSVKTKAESDALYKQINEELKRNGRNFNVNATLNGQLAESKNNLISSPMYQSEEVSEVLNLMQRMDNIK